MPALIKPMLATLVDEPFSDPDWIFETKWDGFRSVCFLKNGKARFVSRNQIEMTPQYPELAGIAKQVLAKEAILDGEICALDPQGIPRFQMLQRKGATKRPPIVYFVFDLLYVDGYDLTACTVVERKARLAEIIQPSPVIKLSEHIAGDGHAFFHEIEKFRLEGMMAKRANSKYVQKRSSDWQDKDRDAPGGGGGRLHAAAGRALILRIAGVRTLSRRRTALRGAQRWWLQREIARLDLQTHAASQDR